MAYRTLAFLIFFGAKSLQTVHADYQQVLAKKHLLTIQLDRRSGGAIVRNATYSESDMKLDYWHRGKIYQSRFFLSYTTDGGADVIPLEQD